MSNPTYPKEQQKPRQIKNETAFQLINGLLMLILGLITLVPFLHIAAKAISGSSMVLSGKVFIIPKELQFNAVKSVLAGDFFLNSFGVSVTVTVVGTVLCLIVTCLTAYPLSKTHLKGRKVILLYFVFTMMFGGGIVPNYLLIKKLGMMNQLTSLILPGVLSVYYMLIMKNFF